MELSENEIIKDIEKLIEEEKDTIEHYSRDALQNWAPIIDRAKWHLKAIERFIRPIPKGKRKKRNSRRKSQSTFFRFRQSIKRIGFMGRYNYCR